MLTSTRWSAGSTFSGAIVTLTVYLSLAFNFAAFATRFLLRSSTSILIFFLVTATQDLLSGSNSVPAAQTAQTLVASVQSRPTLLQASPVLQLAGSFLLHSAAGPIHL